jgi:hypothetical protein
MVTSNWKTILDMIGLSTILHKCITKAYGLLLQDTNAPQLVQDLRAAEQGSLGDFSPSTHEYFVFDTS